MSRKDTGARIALGLLFWSLTLQPAVAQEVAVGEGPRVTAAELIKRSSDGRPVELHGAIITGDLDLRPLGGVKVPMRCIKCRFEGAFTASDVIFERILDFTGSEFRGPVELSGGIFKESAGFEDTAFSEKIRAISARFLHDLSFSEAEFSAGSIFDRSSVGRSANFANARFRQASSFRASEFKSKADFRRARFQHEPGSAAAGKPGAPGAGESRDSKQTVCFEAAVFGGPAYFLNADFRRPVTFKGAEFSEGGRFRLSKFREGLTFDHVVASGPLDFELAEVRRGDITFDNLVSSGPLSLLDLRLKGGANLYLTKSSVSGLTMDVYPQEDRASVQSVRGIDTRRQILALLERTAKGANDLAVANDARYELLELDAAREDRGTLHRLGNWLYREVAGYLVRPENPLRALLVLLGISWSVRAASALWRKRSEVWVVHRPAGKGKSERLQRSQEKVLVFEKGLAVVFHALAASISVAFKPKAQIAVADPDSPASYAIATVHWCEYFLYKILLALLLLALGNANSTIREIFDAVRG